MKRNLQSIALSAVWLLAVVVSLPVHRAEAQTAAKITVSGVVTDASQRPIPGVTVIIKDSFSGTTTDGNGHYSIKAGRNDVLEFSSLGYATQNVSVAARTDINVTLAEDTQQIETVVVEIGYGEQRKKDVSGSVGIVNIDDMVKAPVSSFDQALQGRIAGVNVTSSDGQPGTDFNVVIRGANSLTQDNSPLYVIDGFPIENLSTSALNPEEIESMTVLKDASASAIYGSRGANGVIIIETKKGNEGRPTVTYSGTFGVQSVTKTMEMMTPYEYVTYLIERDPSNEAKFLEGQGRTMEYYKNAKGIDWQDKIFRTAFVHMHNVSVRGGNKMTKYSVSGSYNNQKGIIVNSGYRKIQGRVSLDQRLSKYVRLNVNVNYTQDKVSGQTTSAALSSSNSYATYLMYRTWAFRPVLMAGQTADDLFDDESDGTGSSVMNPYITTMNEDRHNVRQTLMSNAKLDFQLARGLKLTVRGGYTNYSYRLTEFNGSESYKGYPRPSNSKGVHASVTNYMREDWMNENILSYARKYNKLHNFNAMVAFTVQGTRPQRYSFENTQIPNEKLGLSGMDDGIPYTTTVTLSENRLMSALARVNYNYKSRYMLTASFRADGSSKFMKGHRWGYFPSGAVAWRIGEEPWLRRAKWLDEAKLRFSVGMTGNNRVGDFSAYPTIAMNDYYSFDNTTPQEAYIMTNMGNRNLTWETTTQYNLGLDLAFLDNRINVTFDIYRKNTDDLLLNANMPYSSGFTKVYKNIGSVRNDGLEFSFSTVNVRTRDFQWTSDFNISFNRSRVLALTEDEEFLLSKVSFTNDFNNTYLYIARVGGPVASFYGYQWDGVYGYDDFDRDAAGNYTLKKNVPSNGDERDKIQPGDIKYIDQNGDGIVNDKDMVVIGRCEPIHTGGFNNNFTYKGLSLNIFFQWSYGNDIMNANRIMFEGNAFGRNINQFRSYTDRWSPDNQGSRNFRTGGQGPTGYYSSRTIEDGSFLRLKTVQLSYKLPQRWMKRIRISSLEVFVSGQNLWTWTKYSGLDPEVSTRPSALTPGFDYSAYARNRIFTGGIKLTF
ncbi:MAG: TonB-dependent receptor [Alistipes sp.]|nr:TonB-dependent receptor [Alistipes sp.]